MNCNKDIERVLDYIEDNLKNEISIEQLASIAGYSKYHFVRFFNKAVKLTPADYIRKRRVSEIAREMMASSRPVSDIALEYGFNSKENFTRAFKDEHRILPTEYRFAKNSLKLYERINLEDTPFTVTPKLIELEAFSLTGYLYYDDYIPNYWNKYNSGKLSKSLSGGKSCADFGICIWNGVISRLEYFIGIRTDEACGDISKTVNVGVSGGLHAMFTTPETTHFDYVNTVHQTWDCIRSWLSANDAYRCTGGYQFETRIEESDIFSEDIYIPVQKT